MSVWFEEGDKVKVDDAGQYHLATVVGRGVGIVWVTLDIYERPNPIWFKPEDLEHV